MSRLLERLSDPARSGVYRVAHGRDIEDALSGSPQDIVKVSLGPGKEAILAAIAHALDFPEWFGGNWDALEDCLTDLSWRTHPDRVILFASPAPGDDFGILTDVLGAAAEFWRSRGRPFFAVFVDPAGVLALPPLYRERSR